MGDLLVIGGASLDVLHFAGRTVSSAGGAGLYTAAAAQRMGARVTMYAPRPEPMPAALQPLVERVNWIGPSADPDQMPRFEIAHFGGGESRMLSARMGSESELDPSGLPSDLSGYGYIHIVPLGTTRKQLEFLAACRRRGGRRISVGTYDHLVADERAQVEQLLEGVDAFFLNGGEARALFGSAEAARCRAGGLIFVTLGNRGALVVQGEHQTHLPAPQAKELDPTGAGDSFCGATLFGLIRGRHPVQAARQAMPLAAQVIQAVGPQALWDPGPLPAGPDEQRLRLNLEQIERVASLIAVLPEVAAYDFSGPGLPPAEHPHALGYFFAATLQQFGFWEMADGGYLRPMTAPIQGTAAKGSDYLWRAYLRELDSNGPAFFEPRAQAALSQRRLQAVLKSDDGSDPLPAIELHLSLARAYGADMIALGLTPEGILEQANRAAGPLARLLGTLDHIGGYKEDPLRKKSALLALVLAQRPERFLKPGTAEDIPPIIDYHLMRSCLRIGLVDILDGNLEARLISRRELPAEEEWTVRHAAYQAIRELVRRSSRSMGAVDWFFFNARRRCPEMVEPICEQCPVDPVCLHRKELFQPVLRTSFY